ncbi:glycosyltransferase [Gulosibacter sediminis]|uniref:glycosyltransferase n=1 Tax=Gulosibacter sediminis TaxID=1729695 RepID=UPI0024A8BE84|nr:glycosyltransferase [Gulosibacter sediminis]
MTRESSESNVTFVILGVIFSVVYGGIAVYVFCLSGLAGEFGESVWRDIAGIVVSITAMLALTYASLLVLTYRRPDRSEPGDPSAFEWHFLVPCRDEEAVIGETISSARTSFPNCHVWVIDDASEDATAAIVRDLMDIDPNVHLVSRVAPNARLGKGKALNAAFRSVSDFVGGDAALRQRTIIGVLDADGYLSDNALELLAGPQGFGSDEHGAAQVEVWMKNRGDRRPRGDRGWYLNGLGRFLVRMQDIEFRTSNSAMQLFRMLTGTVGLGGNGQFARLTVLDALEEAHGDPWGNKLSEDYELGLNIMALGFKNTYIREAHVSQEALPYFRRLLTQRTRWAQGIMECAANIRVLSKANSLTVGGWLEVHYFIAQPVLTMLNLVLVPTLLVLALIDGSIGFLSNSLAWLVVVAGLVFLIAPYAVWPVLYRRRGGERISLLSSVLLGLTYLVYVYLTYFYYPRAIFRMLTGRSSWAKTRRNAEDESAIAATTPAALRTIPLVDTAVFDELVLDLEGELAAVTEIVARFVVAWPRRIGQLRGAVASEQLEAMWDAIGSIRVSAAMLGAPRLQVAAEEFIELLSEQQQSPGTASTETRLDDGTALASELGVDMAAARRSVGEIARVGVDTVVEMRSRYLEVDTRIPSPGAEPVTPRESR